MSQIRPFVRQAMERLDLLMPGAVRPSAHDPLTYALAYVEHYAADVPRLEHEWEFIYSMLTGAWQRAQYSCVVRLVSALAYVVGRLENSTIGEHILSLGIEASRHLHDTRHLAMFSNRLGGLLYASGAYREGWRLWQMSTSLLDPDSAPLGLWEPLSSFAQIVDIVGSAASAQRAVELFALARRIQSCDDYAVALFTRAFYARLDNDFDRAYDDLSCALRLLSLPALGTAVPPAHRHLFTFVIQAELARVQGQYARSQQYTQTALLLAQTYADRYVLVSLLVDQGLYSLQQGHLLDTQKILMRLREVAQPGDAPHFAHCRAHLERSMLEAPLPALEAGAPISTASERQMIVVAAALPTLPAPAAHYPLLSARERAVLHHVAAGQTNSEIAERLVVTPGTVKKHLEHIYTKLAVHTRTAALARARKLHLLP